MIGHPQGRAGITSQRRRSVVPLLAAGAAMVILSAVLDGTGAGTSAYQLVDQAESVVAGPTVTPSGSGGTTETYQIAEGDSLWRVAAEQLGDPHRWQEIYQLNQGRPQADGSALTDPNILDVGWLLLLPVSPAASDPTAAAAAATSGTASATDAAAATAAVESPAASARAATTSPRDTDHSFLAAWLWILIWIIFGVIAILAVRTGVRRRRPARPAAPGPLPVVAMDRPRAEIETARKTPNRDLGDPVVRSSAIPDTTSLDSAVRTALNDDFQAWRAFLHPAHEAMVRRHYNGPARIFGGPGTGKTIVALHRVAHLATLPTPGWNRPILLTTTVPSLVADLRNRLVSLASPDVLDRVEVAHLDELAAQVLDRSEPELRRVDDHAAVDQMRAVLTELDDRRWPAEFLFDEWDQVVLDQAVPSLNAYLTVSRAGRGLRLTRVERGEVWSLIQLFIARLAEQGIETCGQYVERATRHEASRVARLAARRARRAQRARDQEQDHERGGARGSRALRPIHRYRHIVVDATGHLRLAHWRLLQTLVDPEAPDSLFIVGGIPDRQFSLGTLGINIRGRSYALSPSYRTTWEILTKALLVIDGGTGANAAALAGCRSVLRGPVPVLSPYASWPDELDGLVATLTGWSTEVPTDSDGGWPNPAGHFAACVADERLLAETVRHLAATSGLTCVELTVDTVCSATEALIHVGTMPQFQGREYQRLAIVGVTADLPSQLDSDRRAFRSLLFNTMIRTRDTLVISWHGEPNPCVATLWEQNG